MIDFLIVLLVFLWGSALMSALILVRHRQHPACRQFAWAVENDSDIKIAPDFSSKSSQPRLEPSEEEILLYFKHKQCCNLEKARCLGQQLGTQILCLPQDLAQEQLTLEPPLLLHAQMLCLFVSEECVRRLLPDPILHKLVLAQMNDTISEQLPNFYNNLLQYRAYTAYKMCLEEAPAESAASEPTQQQQLHLLPAQKIAHRLHCFLQNRLRLRAVEFQFLHQPDALLLLFQSQQNNALPCCQGAARAASAFCHLHPIPPPFSFIIAHFRWLWEGF